MARKISISFKETRKDLDLYNILMNLDDKSTDIKKILREFFQKNSELDMKPIQKDKKEDVNILNF